MTDKELDAMKYKICCPMCDNKECIKGADRCEAEMWKKSKLQEVPDGNSN